MQKLTKLKISSISFLLRVDPYLKETGVKDSKQEVIKVVSLNKMVEQLPVYQISLNSSRSLMHYAPLVFFGHDDDFVFNIPFNIISRVERKTIVTQTYFWNPCLGATWTPL